MHESEAEERERMVTRQLIARGISDRRVLEAFRRVPRSRFVPAAMRDQAYYDGPLPIGRGQTISQPYMVAVMVDSARLSAESRVLEVGTGSGFQTAILAQIASLVYSLERIAFLAERAEDVLQRLGYTNTRIRVGDGTLGWAEEAPFDAILVSAGAPGVPQPLYDQLALHGRLVVPIQHGDAQMLTVVTRTPSGQEIQHCDLCTFVPLIGEHGWKE